MHSSTSGPRQLTVVLSSAGDGVAWDGSGGLAAEPAVRTGPGAAVLRRHGHPPHISDLLVGTRPQLGPLAYTH